MSLSDRLLAAWYQGHPALTLLRRAVLDGRPAVLRLSGDEKELAFQDTSVPLTSPIGARVLLALYHACHLKLKKPALRSLPALEAYAATETAFRAAVDRILAEEDSRRQRLAEIIADPACARPDELSPYLIDKVMSAHLGHSTYGTMQIASLACHRSLSAPATADHDRLRPWRLVLVPAAQRPRLGQAFAAALVGLGVLIAQGILPLPFGRR